MQTITKKSLKVGKYVNNAHVDKVIKNYKQERWVQNSEKIGKEDSLSAWWSIEEMEEFIEQAKMYGADGVKFHFAAYDKDYQEQPQYAGRQTLVMVGTKQKQTANGVKNKDIYVQTDKGSQILAYNAASLCPPFCGNDTFDFDWADLELGIGGNHMQQKEIGVTLIDKGEGGMIVV